MAKATARICDAALTGSPLVIFGDYDVDGTTAAAMLKVFFDELGFRSEVYIPERLVEGYGLNPIGLQKIRDQHPHNPDSRLLVVTVDNGISAVKACEKATELGIDVIITDHHDLPPELPQAFAILNPKQPDCLFPYRMLAGVGVAFYLMISLRAELRKRGHAKAEGINLRSYLDYVALGTIADLAPLDGVNHILCKIGLQVMSDNMKLGRRPGLAKLLQLSGWTGPEVNATDVGFKIGPRLNAAGRLGTALSTVSLLTSQSLEESAEFAELLHSENGERQQIEKQITVEALAQAAKLSPHCEALVLYAPHWHTGVVGIVASRVLEKFYKPTLVFGRLGEMVKGSGRSTHAFNLFEALEPLRPLFKSFGGHFHAVGASLLEDDLPALQQHLHDQATLKIALENRRSPLFIDGTAQLSDFNAHALEVLEEKEPFGVANPRPKWLIQGVSVQNWQRIGKMEKSPHARISLADESVSSGAPVVAFGFAEEFESIWPVLKAGSRLDVVVEGRTQVFRGKKQMELRLIDFLPPGECSILNFTQQPKTESVAGLLRMASADGEMIQ